MPPKAAASAAPVVRQDFPWALGVLGNPDADPTQLPLALNYLSTFNVPQHLPHDAATASQLFTLVTPFVCANDTTVNTAAIKVVTRLVFAESYSHDELREALCQRPCLQALWAVLAYFHASFEAYAARLLVIQSEPPEPPTPVRPGKPDSRLSKNPPPPVVDPETTLPGPSKYALELAITALSSVVTGSPAAEEAMAGLIPEDVAPLLTVLKHHSSRIQVLALRLMRALLRSEAVAIPLAAAGTLVRLTELLGFTLFGAVREEVLLVLTRLLGTYPPAMQLALDADLPTSLLKHVLAPNTGVPQEEPPTPPPPPPGAEPPISPRPAVPPSPRSTGPSPRPSATIDGAEVAPEVPLGPPPIDFTRPMASSPDRLQELSIQILLQLCKHHHGAVQHLLRLGGMQLLLALLPGPTLPDVVAPKELSRRPSSASDTFIAHALGRGRPSQAGGAQAAKDAWMPYLEAPPTLPLPKARLNSHPLAASLLQTLACMLADPVVPDYWWSVHPTKRLHLQLVYLLRTDAPPKPKLPEVAAPSKRLTPAMMAAAAAAAPPPPPPPPDYQVPPFPEEVRAAALQCMLQLVKDPRWLQLAPYLTLLQQTILQSEEWAPAMVAPLAEILQRIMAARLPPPTRAATAAARPSQSASPLPSPSLTADGAPLQPSQARPAPLTSPSPSVTADGTAPSLTSPSPLNTKRMCNAAPNGLSPEANGLSDTELSSEDVVKALKELANMVRKANNNDPWATAAVAAALLVLPESAIYAPPWPPLPSPPPTPPPPPLPTSQYLWDALGRPIMTDGIKLAHL